MLHTTYKSIFMPTYPLRKLILGGLVIVLAVVIFGLTRSHQPASDIVAPPPKVRIAVLNLVTNLPLMVAREKKLFEARGLQADYIPFQSSNQVIEAMERGDIDMGMGISLVPYFTVEQKDPGKLKVYSTSAMTTDHPFDELIVQSNSPITGIAQLANKKIGVFPGTTATNLAKDYLKKQGIDTNTLTFVAMPPQNQLPALETGAIDALYAYEPGLTIALSKGARIISPSIYATLVDQNPIGAGLITTSFINNQPNAAKKAVAIIDEAIQLQTTNQSQTREIAKQALGFDQTVADRFSLTPTLTNREINKTTVATLAQKLVDIGELPNRPDTTDIFYQP